MSDLVPSVVPLDKGLNLQTAKIVAPPGSVLDCLNYEQVDFQGQKRIDGYARYDGSMLSTIDDYYKIYVNYVDYHFNIGDLIATDNGLFGICVDVDNDANIVVVAIINNTLIPIAGEPVYALLGADTTFAGYVLQVILGSESFASDDTEAANTHYYNLLAYNAILRARVEELPGRIVGLHWFRDRLYAVADLVVSCLDGTTPKIYPNDILTANGETVKVLDSIVLDTTRIVFVDSMNRANWINSGAVTRTPHNGDPEESVGEITPAYETFQVNYELASFFESRSEQQTRDEDGPSGPFNYGWRFIDQGWEVLFENGISLYGSLPSLNQNISGLGIQGPTSTDGDNGRPLILNQKVNITNKQTQVNGWKSSQTPTSYQLETDNLINVDSDSIYGDAYISWNGATGEVIAPGYTTDPIPEYPATNTVVIEDIV